MREFDYDEYWMQIVCATPSGIRPHSTLCTIQARPRGVRRAFLWMSIRFSKER